MKKFLAYGLFLLGALARAETTITNLPLISPSSVASTDIVPMVSVSANETMKLQIGELFSVPSLFNPTFGTVTATLFSGSGASLTGLPAANITGTLGLSQGGTGQSSASAAFGALSPLTTKGDILVYGTADSRLAVGTNGYVLTANSSATNGVDWAAPPAQYNTACRYYDYSGAQTLTSNVDTALNFPTKDFDTTSSATTSPFLFTAPSTGKYHASAAFNMGASLQGGMEFFMYFLKNNSTVYGYSRGVNDSSLTAQWGLVTSDTIPLSAGDTLAVHARWNGTTNNLSTTPGANFIAIELVSN